jgi:hypothetical protein
MDRRWHLPTRRTQVLTALFIALAVGARMVFPRNGKGPFDGWLFPPKPFTAPVLTATVPAPNGGVAIVRSGAVGVPVDLPVGTPLYPGAALERTVSSEHSTSVTFATPDSSDQVLAFYRSDSSFRVVSEQPVGDVSVLHLQRVASGVDMDVLTRRRADHTEITLQLPTLPR